MFLYLCPVPSLPASLFNELLGWCMRMLELIFGSWTLVLVDRDSLIESPKIFEKAVRRVSSLTGFTSSWFSLSIAKGNQVLRMTRKKSVLSEWEQVSNLCNPIGQLPLLCSVCSLSRGEEKEALTVCDFHDSTTNITTTTSWSWSKADALFLGKIQRKMTSELLLIDTVHPLPLKENLGVKIGKSS